MVMSENTPGDFNTDTMKHRYAQIYRERNELLAALKELVQFRELRELENGVRGDTTGRYARARAVIAKAEGK
jgi:hypothetical protein